MRSASLRLGQGSARWVPAGAAGNRRGEAACRGFDRDVGAAGFGDLAALVLRITSS
jgi:hypothetical protein